jgi:hypothetical protein
MANLLPPAKSAIVKQNKSAFIKADKFIGSSSKIEDKTTKIRTPKKPGQNLLLSIEKKVIKIDKLLKTSLELKKKGNEKQRKGKERGSFEEKEKELENKKQPKVKGINLPSPPKLGIFDWIKNFIFNTLLGFIAVRLIDHLPKLQGIFSTVLKVGEFIIDIAGKLLNGLVTFVDWGYKAVDATRGFIKNIGGEGLAKNFDMFTGAVDKVLEVALITALATADSGGGGDLLDLAGDFAKDKILKRGVQQAAGSAGQAAGAVGETAGIGAGAAAGIVAGAGLLSSALGEAGFQLRKVAIKPIQGLEKEYKNDRNPFTKIGRGVVLNMVRPLYNVFSAAGFLLDVVGAPFRYAIELLRFPFLSDKDKVTQAKNLAKFDSRIREDLRKALNMITLGFAFKEKGSFGNIYGNKGAQKEMMSKMPGLAGGGRPIKAVAVTRSFKKKKKKARTLSISPPKIKPGKNVGGDKKIQNVFPNPEKPQGFLGWLQSITGGGQKQEQQTPKKPSEKTANTQEFLVKSNDVLGKADFFGPIFTLALKSVLGDKPGKLDYMNVGKGLNAWMQTTLKSGSLGFAGGGEVDAKQFFQGEDYTDVIAKSVEDSVSGKVNQTIRDLANELSLRPVGKEEMLQDNIRRKDDELQQLDENGNPLPGLTVGKWGPLLDLISKTEGGYDSLNPSLKRPQILGMTIKELVAFQKQSIRQNGGTAAAGRYQFLYPEGAAELAGISLDEKFTKENQDKMAVAYLEKKRKGREWLSGKISDEAYMQDLADEWASLPNAQGKFSYSGQGSGTTPKMVRDALSKVRKGGYSSQEITQSRGGYSGSPDLSGVERGDPSNAAARLLHDFPQIRSRKNNKQIYASGLGFWMKKNFPAPGQPDRKGAGDYGDPRGGRDQMEHPDHGGVLTNHAGQGHNMGTALDLGGNGDSSSSPGAKDQDYMWTYIKKFMKIYGLDGKNTMPIVYNAEREKYGPSREGSGYFRGHNNHLHVEFAKGGETPDGATPAIVGEKGKEYVINADSYKAVEKVTPGLLDILNYNVNDKASLQKNMPSIIASLSKYTSYEDQSEIIVVLDDAPEKQMDYASAGPSMHVNVGSRGIDNTDYETLEML